MAVLGEPTAQDLTDNSRPQYPNFHVHLPLTAAFSGFARAHARI